MRTEYRPLTVDRRFMAILGLSVCLHGGLFLLQLNVRKQLHELTPIFATLRPASVAPLVESPPAHAAPVPAVPPKVRQPSARPGVAPPRERIAAAAPTLKPAPVVAAQSSNEVASQAMLEHPAVAAQPAVAAPALPAQGDLLADYRKRLGELFSSHQVYPRIAALRGWEGEVRVRLKVARKGNLLQIQLEHSSGFEVLDRHALAMVGDLPGLPALPEGWSGDELQLVVPIAYKLSKAT